MHYKMTFEEHEIMPYLLSRHPYLEREYQKVLNCYLPYQEKTDDWLNIKITESPKISFCAQLMSFEASVYSFIKTTASDSNDIQNIFMDIELILNTTVNEEIIGAFEVCFFENMINVISNDNFPADSILSALGSTSRELCRRNEMFWGTNYLGLINKDN